MEEAEARSWQLRAFGNLNRRFAMKLIESAVFVIGLLLAGGYTLREAHDAMRRVALAEMSRGLQPLTKLNKTLHSDSRKPRRH